jgi:transcriptional regulator with XRE-family HTH domain
MPKTSITPLNEMTLREDFSNWLALAMKNSHKISTQNKLAAKARVGQSTIGRVLRCESNVELHTFLSIVYAASVDPETALQQIISHGVSGVEDPSSPDQEISTDTDYPNLPLIGERIAWIRSRLDMTQKQFGVACGGVSGETVSRWESGEIKMPQAPYLFSISDFSGYSHRWIVFNKHERGEYPHQVIPSLGPLETVAFHRIKHAFTDGSISESDVKMLADLAERFAFAERFALN